MLFDEQMFRMAVKKLTAEGNRVLTGEGLMAAKSRSDLRAVRFTLADMLLSSVRRAGGL